MGPFGILDPTAATHTPGASCASCLEGWPRPCPRVAERGFQGTYDDAGRQLSSAWVETRCSGEVHAEVVGGAIETRCSACGVTR
jgi:hypothetical protein